MNIRFNKINFDKLIVVTFDNIMKLAISKYTKEVEDTLTQLSQKNDKEITFKMAHSPAESRETKKIYRHKFKCIRTCYKGAS